MSWGPSPQTPIILSILLILSKHWDVEGDKTDFTELFHDQGDTDQFALMRTYRELGLDVPVRGDHVPEMAYDRVLTPEGTPGYFTLGRLFANGYLKALLKSIA